MKRKVIYNIASYRRKELIGKVINSIYDQADIINIALNDYDEIPIELYDNKIRIFMTDNSKGDAYKFLELKNSDGYYFTIDDDLLYPKDYTKYMIEKFLQYKNKIITLHGRNFLKFPIHSYYHAQVDYYPCLKTVNKDIKVHVGGTGVMCFDTQLFKIPITYFEHANMADIWIAKYAKLNNIDIMCVKHDKDFLTYLPVKTTIYESTHKDDSLQTNIINSLF